MRARVAAAAAAVLVAATGCGGGSSDDTAAGPPDQVRLTPGPDGTQAVEIDADDHFRFHPSQVDAAPGSVKVTLRHTGTGAPHDFVAAQLPGAQIGLVRGGESRSVTFKVSRPGTYRFVCTIHEAQGQVGQLVVAAR